MRERERDRERERERDEVIFDIFIFYFLSQQLSCFYFLHIKLFPWSVTCTIVKMQKNNRINKHLKAGHAVVSIGHSGALFGSFLHTGEYSDNTSSGDFPSLPGNVDT